MSQWGMWDLILPPGVDSPPPILGARSLDHWTTRVFLFSSLSLWNKVIEGCLSHWDQAGMSNTYGESRNETFFQGWGS